MWEEFGTEYRVSAHGFPEGETFGDLAHAEGLAASLKKSGYTAVCIETQTIYKTSIIDRIDWK